MMKAFQTTLCFVHVLRKMNSCNCGCTDKCEFGNFECALDCMMSNGVMFVFVFHNT